MRIFKYFLGVCFLLVLLIALCVPMLFSTAGGKKMLLKMISNRTGMHIEIEELSINWFGAQQIQGLHLQNTQDQLTFECKEIRSDASLWKIAFLSDLGHIKINEPHLILTKPLQPISRLSKHKLKAASLITIPEIGFAKIKIGMKGDLIVEMGRVEFTPPGFDPIVFDQITASLISPDQNRLSVSLNCNTLQHTLKGQIAIKGSALEISESFPAISIQSTITRLPVRGIDQFLSLLSSDFNGLVYSAVGESLDLACNFNASKGNFDLSLDIESPQLKAQIATTSIEGILSLKNPGTINFTLTPTFVQKFSKVLNPTSVFILTQPTLLQANLVQFSCPMPTQIEDLMEATFLAKVTAPPQIAFLFNEKPLTLSQLTLNADRPSKERSVTLNFSTQVQTLGQIGSLSVNTTLKPLNHIISFNASKLPVDLFNLVSPSSIPFSDFLGPTFTLNGSLSLRNNAQLEMNWSSNFLTMTGMNFSIGNDLTLNSPAQFTYILNPNLLPQGDIKFTSLDPIQGTLQILSAPMNNLQNARFEALFNTGKITVSEPVALSTASMKALVSIDGMKLKGEISSAEMILGLNNQQTFLQNLSIPFQCDSKGKTAGLQLLATLKNPLGNEGSLVSQWTISKGLTLPSATIQGSLDLKNISSILLDTFLKKVGLSALIGPTFNATLKVQSTPEKQTIALKGSSANLNFDTALLIDGAGVQLQGGNTSMTWALTPEGYKILDQIITGPKSNLAPFEMKETSLFNISLSKLLLPVLPGKMLWNRFPELLLDMNKMQMSVNLRNSNLTFLDKTSQETIQLSKLAFSFDKNKETDPFMLSLETAVQTQGELNTAKNGSLLLKAKLDQMLNLETAVRNNKVMQQVLDVSKLSGSFQMKIDQFPSRALDIIARANGRTDFPFTTVFGNVINSNVSADLKNFSGPILLNIHSPMTRASLNGILKEGALTLTEDIYAQIKITPEMSRLVLKEVNPLDLSYVYSQDPITLQIPAEGFYFPFFPLMIEKITIPDATIELGKITCRNEGNVNIALKLLKSRQFDQNNDLSLWFAPIDLAVKTGWVDIDRVEILLSDTFDICLWGKVDLIKDYINMTLGLTANTLRKAFGIKKLPNEYVLTIPMKGPADNVKIDTGKATTKIALLLAWQQKAAVGALGGPAGAAIGGLLDKMATLPDSGTKVPPAKHPFPWEIGTEAKTSDTSNEKKRHFKQNEKPLKQIMKILR